MGELDTIGVDCGVYGRSSGLVRNVKNTIISDNGCPPFEVYELPIHEAENLIPLSVLSCLEQVQARDGFAILQRLQNAGKTKAILYYDFKKGFPYIREGPKRQYWKEMLCLLEGNEDNMPPVEDPQECKGEEDEAQYFSAVGRSDLLKAATQHMQLNPDYQIDAYLQDFWNEIGEIMLAWGCASAPFFC